MFYMTKYALYAGICITINMQLYANLNLHKQAQNMQKYHDATICTWQWPHKYFSYAFICTRYAKICKICKHEICMQKMQKYALPTLLMNSENFQCSEPTLEQQAKNWTMCFLLSMFWVITWTMWCTKRKQFGQTCWNIRVTVTSG